MIEVFEFNKAEELFDYLSPWGKVPNLHGYVFRGHSQEQYKLIPSALRPESVDEFWKVCGLGRPINDQHEISSLQIQAEYQLIREFYRLADQRGLEVPLSDRMRKSLAQNVDFHGAVDFHYGDQWIRPDLLETAALAQHYGIPTRLLDWTYDVNIAIYFACRDALEKVGKMVIWAINKDHLSFLKPTTARVNVEFITPHYSENPNLNAQKGLFTHWPVANPPLVALSQKFARGEQLETVDRRSLDKLVLASMKDPEPNLTLFKKFILPCSEASRGCQILSQLGYDSARVFPGYGGVAEQILSRHKYR